MMLHAIITLMRFTPGGAPLYVYKEQKLEWPGPVSRHEIARYLRSLIEAQYGHKWKDAVVTFFYCERDEV